MNQKLPNREDVETGLTWDLTSLYQTEDEAVKKLKALEQDTMSFTKKYKGKLFDSSSINLCLNEYRNIKEKIVLEENYAELSLSVDHTNTHLQELYHTINSALHKISSILSFVASEIVSLKSEIIEHAAKESRENKVYLENLLRQKNHMLSADAESVLAAYSGLFDAPYQIYQQTKLADMDFPSFFVDDKEYPLAYSLWENVYEYEEDPRVRRTAFQTFSNKLKEYQNTTAAAYQLQVEKEKTTATLRGFKSVFDYLLFDQKVDKSLYDRQIDLIMEKLAPHMQKYATLLKHIHHLDHMTYADLKIAVDPTFVPNISIDQSKKYIENALCVLGEDYLDMIKTAYKDRWIDFVQNKGKETGGFCSSPYGKNSFILLSWSQKMSEVFTLAHELGHAGHFKLCNEAQSIFDVDVSSYFVESPSTLNELLMANYLLKTNTDKRFKRWVLSSMISHTYYHNFVTHLLEAVYQREVYAIIDQGGSVTAETLNQLKRGVLEKFWGDSVEISDNAALTWMRQPHYYMGLYSYTYSAGLTIATQVSKRILETGKPAVDAWRTALTAGSTKTPIELASLAGVDITTDKPLLDTIEYIGSIIDEIIALTNELEKQA